MCTDFSSILMEMLKVAGLIAIVVLWILLDKCLLCVAHWTIIQI